MKNNGFSAFLPLLIAVSAWGAGLSPAMAQAILADAEPTINLPREGNGQSNPMAVAYHPGQNRYYGGDGGRNDYPGFTWDAAGNLLDVQAPINMDVRAYNFNPNTGNIEVVTFSAVGGGSPDALMTAGLDANGFLSGTNTTALSAMPGLPGTQTMPAYDPAADVFYARSTTGTVNIVNRSDGTLAGTISLDLAAAGTPTLQSDFVGYDRSRQLLITVDTDNERALVHDLSGNFLGASNVVNFNPQQANFSAGYANGQLFLFDTDIDAYRGFSLFEEALAPSMPIPTMQTWGLLLLVALMLGTALLATRRYF